MSCISGLDEQACGEGGDTEFDEVPFARGVKDPCVQSGTG